jgi:hypothetical protein
MTEHRRLMVTKTEIAKRRGCAKSTVTRACRSVLAPAVHHGRVDLGDPLVQQWLARPAEPVSYDYAIPLAELARLCGVTEAVVDAALQGDLGAALCEGQIDLGHDAALESCAAFPFPRNADGQVDEKAFPEGFGVSEGDQVDVYHPLARAFLCRCWGRVPTLEELEAA